MASEKGLENRVGENNCFLNVVIQSLWHLRSFREYFKRWELKCTEEEGEGEGEGRNSCVHCALQIIFTQFEYAECPYIPPVSLREALERVYFKDLRFKQGELEDAAEAMDAVLTCLHSLSSRFPSFLSPPIDNDNDDNITHNNENDDHKEEKKEEEGEHSVKGVISMNDQKIAISEGEHDKDDKDDNKEDKEREEKRKEEKEGKKEGFSIAKELFGIEYEKGYECGFCGTKEVIDKPSYYIEYTYSSLLRDGGGGGRGGEKKKFEEILYEISKEQRTCPNCDQMCEVTRSLSNTPEILILGLIWDSAAPSAYDIQSTLQSLQHSILLPKTLGDIKAEERYGELMGMICYQGRHYTAYFYSESCRRWLMFDDALVSDVGSSWTDVLNKCCSYSLYPSILFYQSLPPNTTPSSHQSETNSFIPKLLFSPQFFPPSRPPPSINLSSSSPLHPHPHPHPHPRPLHPHPHPHPQPLLQPHPHPSLANPLINQPQINQQQMNQPQINQQQVNQHLINQQQMNQQLIYQQQQLQQQQQRGGGPQRGIYRGGGAPVNQPSQRGGISQPSPRGGPRGRGGPY